MSQVLLNGLFKKITYRFRLFLHEVNVFLVRKVRRNVFFALAGRMLDRKGLLSRPLPERRFYYGSSDSVEIDVPPDLVGELPARHRRRLGVTALDRRFVAELRDCTILKPWGLCLTRENRFVVESALNRPSVLDYTMRLKTLVNLYRARWAGARRRAERTYPLACSLVTTWSSNYFHWLFECLTRLEMVDFFEEKTGERPKILIEKGAQKFKIDSLRLLGYGEEDIVRTPDEWCLAERLVVPSVPRQDNVTYPSSCRWLRKRMLEAVGVDATGEATPGEGLIYISRVQAKCRRVANEDEVRRFLEPLGFVTYELENLTFEEQVKLFSKARIVVGPHGAGFANIVFGEDLTMIEFFGRDYMDPCFFTLSTALGFGYQQQVCPSRHGWLKVDVGLLEKQLNKALERQVPVEPAVATLPPVAGVERRARFFSRIPQPHRVHHQSDERAA